MFIRFFILLFLLCFFVSCGSSSNQTSGDREGAQNTEQTTSPAGNDGVSVSPRPGDQAEELYTITMRGDWSVMGDPVLDLYFTNMGSVTDVRKHFSSRSDLVEANGCVVLRKSDFPNLSIRLQLKDKTIECNNSYSSVRKCSLAVSNQFFDLPVKADNGNIVIRPRVSLLTSVQERNPEIGKCFKLY